MNPKDYLRASNGDGEAVRAVVVEERQIGDMLINVDSVLNWPHKGIATSGVVDVVTGLIDPATVAVFFYTLSGSMIHIDEFAAGYDDLGNQQYEIIVLKPTTPWANAVADAAEQPSLPAGGTEGQILTKVSDTDGDADWQTPPEPEAGNSIVTKEVPTGLVNGSNTTFATSQPYIGGSLQVYIRGLAQSFMVGETNPATGQFTISPAPLAGDNVVASYMFGAAGTMAADTVDNFHANATPTPNTLLPLDSAGKLPLAAVPDVFTGWLNRKWANVLSSRVENTNYTNNESYPIDVSITINAPTGTTGRQGRFVVNGVNVGELYALSASNIRVAAQVYVTVPPGGVYQYNSFSGQTSVVIWAELR